jgi:hypothetical protein
MDCPKEGRCEQRVQRPIILPRERSWRYNPDTDKASGDDERMSDDERELLRQLFPLESFHLLSEHRIAMCITVLAR